MVNIVIKEPDTLFQRGLTFLFSDFFSQHNTKVDFNFNFTSESVKVADVIVLALCPGECFICCPELQERKKGIVIGVVDDDMRVTALPSCFRILSLFLVGIPSRGYVQHCTVPGTGCSRQIRDSHPCPVVIASPPGCLHSRSAS